MIPTDSSVHSEVSWWYRDAIAYEGNLPDAAPLTGRHKFDVVIVGGGFAGLWTALTLHERRPGVSIALIEARTCGSGASGKNGGMVSGYWSRLAKMEDLFGKDQSLAVARAASKAQQRIRDYVRECGEDLWWQESGTLLVSVHPEHDARAGTWVRNAARFGVPGTVTELDNEDVAKLCVSPLFRGGALFPDSALVHPARLARSLRRSALAKGIAIYEHSPMIGLDRGTPNRVRCEKGEAIAREVVLATNIALTDIPEIRRHISMFSSYVAMSEPAGDFLERIGWKGAEGIVDSRQFIRYARKTPDQRILAGWGGGPLAAGSDHRASRLYGHGSSSARVRGVLREWFPQALPAPRVAASWGGGIDVSADQIPFFKTLPGTRVHYAGGFSGHGVNATCLAGQCMASLVLGETDEWSTLALCTRDVPSLPPEPFRYLGASAIRWGILTLEDALEAGHRPPMVARLLADLPGRLGLRIGRR
jgi:glycine/D-amino acid oxidase-like deaminating enzyme